MIFVYAILIAVCAGVAIAFMIAGISMVLRLFAYQRGSVGAVVLLLTSGGLIQQGEMLAAGLCAGAGILWRLIIEAILQRRLAVEQKQFYPYGRTAQSYHRAPNEPLE